MTYPHEWSVAGVIIKAVSGGRRRQATPLTDWLVSGPYSDNEWTRIQQAELRRMDSNKRNTRRRRATAHWRTSAPFA